MGRGYVWCAAGLDLHSKHVISPAKGIESGQARGNGRTDVGKGKERVGRLCKLPHGSLCHGLGAGEIGKNLAMQL